MTNRWTSVLKLNIGFWLGIAGFWTIYLMPAPEGMTLAGQKTAAVAVLMICWWISEAIPIPATALVPLAAFPLFGILTSKAAAAPYANQNVFLFLGGFCIALTMQKWNLHRRIALYIIRMVGARPRQLVLGFMVATAFLSMWISNTATAMMMLPIGIAIIHHFHKGEVIRSNFAQALMLSIAYSASIGGIGTLIGTPPNIVFAGQIRILFPDMPEIGFFQWMKVGMPLVVIFLPIVWAYLTYLAFPLEKKFSEQGGAVIDQEIGRLGPMKMEERVTLLIFVMTCLGWMFRKSITVGPLTVPGWSNLLGIEKYVHDSTIAIISALVCFMVPTDLKNKKYLLDWESTRDLPWGILLLFGGGFALAKGFESSGLSQWIGDSIRGFSQFPTILMVATICVLITFLTEVTSNTATTTMILPILGAMAPAIGVHPYLLMLPATISASCAFMTPVATPPNAIVFGSGHVSIREMAKTGAALNVIGVVLVTLLIYFVAIAAFGIR